MEQLKKIRNTPVKELMNTNILMIDGSKMVSEALAMMKKHDANGVMVRPRNEDDTYGLVTEKDILEKVIDPGEEIYSDPWNTPCFKIMSKPCISVYPEMRLKYALRMMHQYKIRRVLVIDHNEVVGLLCEKDILKAVQELPVNNTAAI